MEFKENLISIVVPVYNAKRFIKETIKSVLEQTISNWELILVDDCSTDGSYDLIKTYESDQIRIFQMHENGGQAKARNFGRKKARGRYLAFLDADDLWSPNKLETEFSYIREHEYAFVFTGYEFAGEDGKRNGHIVKVPESVDYKYALKNTTISTITVMFDRTKVKDELLEMPSGVRGEDSATWWQILRHGYTAHGINEPLSVYRRYGQSHSSHKLWAVWGTYKMYRQCEHFSVIKSWYYFVQYVYHAVMRRI